MSRAYTVQELDDLRRAVENKELWGTSQPHGPARMSRAYSPGELERIVEERVRTHMLAGHTADDFNRRL